MSNHSGASSGSWPRICGKYFLSFPQKKSCHRNWRNKKLNNFAKLQFWDAKIDQNTNFAKLPSAKLRFCKSYHSRIKVLQSCTAFYCVSFSGERFSWGNERKIFPHCLGLIQFKILKIFPPFFAGRRQCQLNGEAKTVKTNTAHDRSGKPAGSSSKNIFRIGLHAPEPEISNVHSEPAMNRKSVNVHFNAAQGVYIRIQINFIKIFWN